MVKLIETVYNFLWGDLLTAPLPGGGTLPLSLLVILLIPTGVYFTIRTKFLPIRLFKDMVGALFEKKRRRTKRTFRHPDFDCFHSNSCWNGQSGRCSCRNFRWRSWCCFLDVDFCYSWNVYEIFRSNTCSSLQRT